MAQYAVRKRPKAKSVDAFSAYPPILSELLFARGIETIDVAEQFLKPVYERDTHDPFLLPDMEKAVERILSAIQEGELIAIYSDYDCDGIPGGALLKDFFSLIGYEKVINYIPHRDLEGYGVNIGAIEKLKEQEVSLIITVDVGITDSKAVERANELGIDVVLTDHHLPLKDAKGADMLPHAYAVVNPKRADSTYPFDGLCGTGVAYKLAQALLERGNFNVAPGQEKWLLDLVGIATIADMVPLIGENRTLAHYGLRVLRKTRRPGLTALFNKMRMNRLQITEDDIGFMIAPRINAASRMDKPEEAFRLLSTDNDEEARELANHLDRINNIRKGVVAGMVREMKKRAERESNGKSIIVLGNPEWKPALLGLAANTLMETYGKPVCLWGRDGSTSLTTGGGEENCFKGSCRSNSVNVVSLMEEADTIKEFGGHAFSCGFSVSFDDVHTLSEVLNKTYKDVARKVKEPIIEVDRALPLCEVNSLTVQALQPLAPFGEGNPKPLFLFEGVKVKEISAFGKGKDHLKVILSGADVDVPAIAFYKKPEDFSEPLEEGRRVRVVGSIEESSFGGRREVRVRLVDSI